MHRTAITTEIDISRLAEHSDAHLAALWHFAPANPAPIEDRDAGELAKGIGGEIIGRWLQATPPGLWRHHGRQHCWYELTALGTSTTDGIFAPADLADEDKLDAPRSASSTGAPPRPAVHHDCGRTRSGRRPE